MLMKTRKQEYAIKAFEQVSTLNTSGEFSNEFRKRYRSMAHKLPVLIRTAGLAQALEFVNSRNESEKDNEYKVLLRHLENNVLGANVKAGMLLELSRNESITEYILLTRNCLAALLWYKRFAESVLDIKDSDASEDEGGDE